MILSVKDLKQHYRVQGSFGEVKTVKAVDGVSFSVERKKILAIVGESGCGKSTLGRVLLGVEPPTAGQIFIDGRDVTNMRGKRRYADIQMIFQDPYSSLNPRKKAWQLVAEPLLVNTELSRRACKAKALEILEQVGIRPEAGDRYPHMFSGGQRQRLGIARALTLRPKVLVLDEPVSALDVSIQAQVLNLLVRLQKEFDLTFIFISHDLSVVRHLADEVAVMYLGRFVESGVREDVFESPQHPYTQALLSCTPNVFGGARQRVVLEGELPSPMSPPSGCHFHKRCRYRQERCLKEAPTLRTVQNRLVSCHFAGELRPVAEADKTSSPLHQG